MRTLPTLLLAATTPATLLLLGEGAADAEATPQPVEKWRRALQGFPEAPPGAGSPPEPAPRLNPVQAPQTVCEGDTRGDRRCNHAPTHRVCARIGDPDTSFWEFTHQTSWCGTRGRYFGAAGNEIRCPPEHPTWCICKWATADWIQGETCNDRINIDCAASDICATEQGLFFSYDDYDVDLHPAHVCVEQKCAAQWAACERANPAVAMRDYSKHHQPDGGGH